MKYNFLALLIFFSTNSYTQNLWHEVKIDEINVRNNQETRILPSEFKSFKADYSAIKSLAFEAPSEDISVNINSNLVIDLPLPSGDYMSFKIYDSPTMESGLAAKYPEIRSFKGIAIDDPLTTVRFDFGYAGFHAAIHGPDEVIYIDPYIEGDNNYYLSYNVKHDIVNIDPNIPYCGVDHSKIKNNKNPIKNHSRADIIPLRKYRLAIACTGEYGLWKGSVENALSDINTGVNRMNQIFENEASIRMILVNNNDELLNFDPATDPYPNPQSGSGMLAINTGIISSRIGVNAYDIGHVYHRACDTGGIASLGSHCNINTKGAAVTCHRNGDIINYAIGTTAHEIGHQMSAQHTFNHCDQQNESLGNGVEPGSGSTIMSYAGLCGPQLNLQGDNDDYYHTASLLQIYNHTRLDIADECASKESFGNHEPVITLPEVFNSRISIPENTYFYLEGFATDEDENTLTYAWDPMNTGPLSGLGSPIGEAPRFRAYYPSEDQNIRYFPRTLDIFNNFESNVEVLPVGGLEMKFHFTVRDNNPMGGTAVWEPVEFDVIETSEKFGITYPDQQGMSVNIGDEIEILWNVAETDIAPINSPTLDIYFTDVTSNLFDINDLIPLALCVPNDGAHTVRFPNRVTNRGRIILKSVNNIFFDINPYGIQVKEPVQTSLYANVAPLCQEFCVPSSSVIEIDIETQSYGETELPLNIRIEGLPEDAIVTLDNPTPMSGETVTATIDLSNVIENETFEPNVVVENNDGSVSFNRSMILNLIGSEFSDMQPTEPENGSSGQNVAPLFKWTPSAHAKSYDIEISDNPTFENIISSKYNITDTEYSIDIVLNENTVYYWRVKGSNGPCSEYSKIQAFSTKVFACEEIVSDDEIGITQSGTPTIEAEFVVLTQGTVADINLPLMKGDHTNTKDLEVSLVSPSGTEVPLFANICPQQNFRVGFDDDSNIDVKCPVNQGDIYKPLGSLSDFNGENPQGIWILRIHDNSPGNGGQLEMASLDICSNVNVESPTIKNLSKVEAPTNDDTFIYSWNMRVQDEDTPDEELTYTIVSLPTLGTLKSGGETLSIGDTFTQDDINKLQIYFTSTEEIGNDVGSFAVEDGQGGWVGIFELEFEVSNDFVSNILDESTDLTIDFFPNPTSGFVTVNTKGKVLNNLEILDIKGSVVKKISRITNNQQINLSDLENGIYVIRSTDKNTSMIRRLVVQK